MVNIDRAAPKVTVGTATVQTQSSSGTGKLNIPKIPYDFPVTGYIMPGLKHTLIGVGPLCDADFTVTFTRAEVIVRDARGITLLYRMARSLQATPLENRPATRRRKPDKNAKHSTQE